MPAAAKGLKAAPLRAAIHHPTVYSIVSALPSHSNQESNLLCLFCFVLFSNSTQWYMKAGPQEELVPGAVALG